VSDDPVTGNVFDCSRRRKHTGAMLAAIEGRRTHQHGDYILEDDEVGRRFAMS